MKEIFTSRFETIKRFLETQRLPTEDWKNIFSSDFWLQSADTTSPYYLFSLAIGVAFLIGLELWRRRIKRLHQITPVYAIALNHIANLFYFVLIIGLSYILFTSQGIAYVSSRLFLLSVIVICLAWVGWVTVHLRRTLPTRRRSYLERERFFRYLPKDSKKGKSK